MTITALAGATGLPLPSMERLVNAAVSLQLLSRRGGGRIGLGMKGAAICGNAGLMRMIEHHALVYRDLADPVALLRGDGSPARLSEYWGYARGGGEALNEADVAAYSDLMAASQTLIADTVLDAYPFDRHRVMLDAGGGDGAFIAKVAERHPHLSFQHFDLPAVSARAVARFNQSGISHRVQCEAGSFFNDDLPKGADLVTLVRILHDHEDASVKKILASIKRAITPGGVLLIVEPLAETRGAESMGDAYFGFYLMAMGSGRARTRQELTAFLSEAGFGSVREIASSIPLQTRLLAAKA